MTDGIDLDQFRIYVVRPTLNYLDLQSRAAENLLLGTALTESRLKYLHQVGGGPARGVFQMEPATHGDIWRNYIQYRATLCGRVERLVTSVYDRVGSLHLPDHRELDFNLMYQAAMCRIHYLRVPEALPGYDNPLGMARYWKEHYNTPEGAGTVDKAVPYFEQACA